MKKEMFKVNVVSLHYKLKYNTTDYPIIKSSKDAADIFYECWDKDTIGLEEQFKVLYLNRRNQVIGLYNAGIGGTDGVIVCNKKILACGLKLVASAMIIAHNHPSGNRKKSQRDTEVTKSIKECGKIMNIQLLDHIILLPNGNYVSFADDLEL